MTSKPALTYSDVTECACRNGLWLGLYLTVLYLTIVWGGRMPVLSIVTLVMLLGIPVLAYMMMRRDRTKAGFRTMGALWLDGLLTFLGGGLLASFVLFVYLRWIDPEFLTRQMEEAITTLSASGDPQMQHLADNCRQAIRDGYTITPILFSMSLLWIVSFCGSILSLLTAMIMKITRT